MDEQEIYIQITPVFQEVFDEDDLVPTPELTAHDVEEWDSLSHIRLICAVEEQFDIRFTSAEVGALKNVGDFVSLIQSKSR